MREYDHEFITGFDPNEKLFVIITYMVAMVDLLVNVCVLMKLGTFQVTSTAHTIRTYGNITLYYGRQRAGRSYSAKKRCGS